MYLIKSFNDMKDLEYKVASDPMILENLARFAQMLGYRCCGIDLDGKAIGKFNVGPFKHRNRPLGYVIFPSKNPNGNWKGINDPYDNAPCTTNSLDMWIRNFRFLIDPDTFVYGNPTISHLEPSTIGSVTAINKSDKEDSISKSFSYQLSETISHTSSLSLTEGGKISNATELEGKATFKIPFIAEGEGKVHNRTTVEVSFSSTQGWADTKSTTYGSADSLQYVGRIPAKSKRTIKLVVAKTESEVRYNANMIVDFALGFGGAFRSSGAHIRAHKDLDLLNVSFGDFDGSSDGSSAFETVLDMYDHRNIPRYSDWDWNWMSNKFGARFDEVIDFIRQRIGTPTNGKFLRVKGIKADIIAEDPQPLSGAELSEAPVATKETAHAIAPEAYIPSDEMPGGRLLSIE